MRSRSSTWFLLCLACLLSAFLIWRLSGSRQSKNSTPATLTAPSANASASAPPRSTNATPKTALVARENRLKYRLSNTTQTFDQLIRSDHAISLENALIDSSRPLNFSIPAALKSEGDSGTYIVQARGPINNAFRALLQEAGATIVSYIPKNAFLVRMSADAAQKLAGQGTVQAAIPFEPYYKLDLTLLKQVMEKKPTSPSLNVLVFPDAHLATLETLRQMGARVVSESPSPFGTQMLVQNALDAPAIARIPGIQRVEVYSARKSANDLSRARVGVASDTITPTNYLGLTGANVTVQVNDSGIDATHPDFNSPLRVSSPFPFGLVDPLPFGLVDTDGHGTHVAGIIGGNGFESTTVSNAYGSIMPGTNGQFRGMAPAVNLFSLPLFFLSDFRLQQIAATNALISNNSWNYGDTDYDINAASYDAAVRDALPGTTGSQPVLFVFSAGNGGSLNLHDGPGGSGGDNGQAGNAETIQSPATAKNVITVGAIEQPRNITNSVVKDGLTNEPWTGMTDSQDQVAGFSGRGNVGIGIEGDSGRFKPDVVAPGTFVVSTRSAQWNQPAYYSNTNFESNGFQNQTAITNGLSNYSIFVPANTLQLTITVFPVNTAVPVPIYVNQTDTPTAPGDFAGNNQVVLTPPALITGNTLFYGIGDPLNVPLIFDVQTTLTTTNDVGDYYQALQQLNDSLAGTNQPNFYRYESGTSMSAADVSGVLALMQEFFQQNNITNSPAMMKALLINGARSVNVLYNFQVQNTINYQGWGLINLPNCIPVTLAPSNSSPATILNALTRGPSPVLLFDQSPTNSLATGDSHTITVNVDTNTLAQTQPLRITLVWTDPPGNPSAGVKLVNDLDLLVTNLDTGEFFVGNDIQSGSDFTFPVDTNTPPNSDVVNNVENVYLAPSLGSSYSITVVGRSVNVNAVTAQTNNIVQDYALVISSGNGETNALRLQSDAGIFTAGFTNVTILTNQFGLDSPNIFGQILTPQRVGANSPLIGTNTVPYVTTNGVITLGETNEWHFYVMTNATSFTNVVFATSLPLNLASSRIGVTDTANPDQATRPQADIDLYVNRGDGSLLTLNSNAVAVADKSLGRGGFEQIVYTNAKPGEVFYIGVKSEDQAAAEYQFTVLFSLFPFNSGNNTYPGFPTPANIPDGSPALPGKVVVTAYAVADPATRVRRVVVTNTITHENFGDLLGNLGHNGEKFTVLNNHTFGNGNLQQTKIYDDSGGNDILGAQHTDGPGSLTDFVGDDINGQWTLIEVDNALTHTGRVDGLTIHIDPHKQDDLPPGGTSGVVLANCVDVAPNGIQYDFVGVPFNAISVQILVSNIVPFAPLQLVVRNNALPTPATFDYSAIVTNGSSLTISLADLPPLQSGTLFFGFYNSNSILVNVCYQAILTVGLAPIPPVIFTSSGASGISDDAVTDSTILVTNNQIIASVAVGVVLNHPRVSDMALTLISPSNERFLLFEDRGALNETNLGHLNITTNFFGTTTAGNAQANTNVIAPVPTSGTLIIDYQFFQVPDRMDVYYDGVLIFTTGGLINGAGQFPPISYGPGTGNSITIVMNQGGNPNTQTAWNYTPRIVSQDYSYLTFTEDTSLATVPIKFLTPPYDLPENSTNFTLSDFELAPGGIYLAPTNIPDAQGGWNLFTNDVVVGTNLLSRLTNQVSVATDTNTARGGSNYLALANGTISRVIPTLVGRKYNITYWYRGPGLVGWWRGEGNALDSSDPEKLGNNGSLIGRFTFPEGEVGQAFQFEGTNGFEHQPQLPEESYVQIRQSASLDVGNGGGFTIECWINPTNIFTPQPLVEWLAPIPTNWAPASIGETNGPSFISDTNFALVAGPFLNRATSHYYYLLADTNWTTSESWANSLGGHLATVEDANEENWIYDMFAQYGGTNRTLWIGLNDAANPGTFAWPGGQTNFFYTNWANAQPSNCIGNQHYVAILNPTNAQASLWTLADNNGNTCGFPPTNRIHGVVEVNEIQTNGVQFWVSMTNSLITGNGCLYADVVDANNGSHPIFSPPGLIQTNGMQHVALTYDRSTGIAALYYSGTNVATTNLGIFVPKTGGDVLLGKHMSRETNNVFVGRMDEVSIYNRFLSASEIQAIYSISALSSNRNIGKFDPAITPALSLAEAQVTLGETTNIILGANTGWQVSSFSFTATSNNIPLQFTGLEPGMLLDTFTVTEAAPGNLYVLPEESLSDLIGQTAQGRWTLEMSDTRVGATSFAAQLISWQMQFIFQNFSPTAVPLSPFDGATNVVPAGKTLYFTVDVPTWASFATNILVSSTSPVDLLFNQVTPPTGTGVGDFTLLGGSTGGIGNPILSAASAPPLRPGLRYYLGVKNSGVADATVVVRVDFDITTLSNGVPVITGFGTNDFVRYFAYDVSSNSVEATFQLLNLSSNVDLVVRKGTPLPTLTSSDYGSFNPSQADENIYVLTNSSPVPLSGGRWYLGLFKRDAGLVTNTVLAKEVAAPPTIIDLTDGVPFTYTAGPGAALTNFFRFTVVNSPRAMHFELFNMSGNVDLTVQTNAPPLAPTFWQSSQQPGLNTELIFIQTNSALTNLNAQWYLGTPNHESNLVTYTILALTETNIFPAFPGAEGAGAGTVGARGANSAVYHVVNLRDAGPGSFRDAVSASFRTVVFDVSGTIALASPLRITSTNLTIAGQTAPGDGITISGFMTSIENTHDVILRDLRFRLGDVNCSTNLSDAFLINQSSNVIADHISASWSIDAVVSATDSTNVTVQWSVISDSLNTTNTTSCRTNQGFGSVLRSGPGVLSFHHNLYADNYSANPRLGDNISLDFVNNVIYNWGFLPGHSGDDTADNLPLGFTNYLNYVDNYLITGTDFAGTNNIRPYIAFSGGSTNTWIFQTNNVMDANINGILDGARTGWGMFTNLYTGVGRPFPLPPISTDEAFLAYERVLAFVGTGMEKRDPVDRLIVGNVRTQSGRIIGNPGQDGGFPTLNSAPLLLDSDGDGIPDYWEITLGENPTNASNNLDRDGDGYSDLEEYVNWLAAPHALTITNTPVDVDLYKLTGNTGNLTFFVTNAVNGTVYLTNLFFVTNGTTILSNTVAVFTPTNNPVNFSGYASFGFYVTNTDTVAYFGPETVSVMVSAVPILTNAPALVVTLTNLSPYCLTSSSGTNGVDFYKYEVATNAYSVQFQVTNLNGNVDLYVKFGLPLPSAGLFDASSANAGLVNESVLISTNTTVLITNGFWYLAVSNASGFAAVSYCVVVTELTNSPVVTLSNLTEYCVTSTSGTNGLDYYRYDISTNAYAVQFEVLNPSADVTLLARYGLPVPSLGNYDYISTNSGTSDELILVLTNSLPVPLTNGAWYLAVSNASGIAPVSYCIRVIELTPGDVITLTNGISYFGTNSGGTNALDYYRYNVSSNALSVMFDVRNATRDVTLVARKGLPLPSLTSFDYISAAPGTNDEIIVVFTNSLPVALSPGDWYLAVANVTGLPVSYAVRATEFTSVPAGIITLTNAIPYANSNSATGIATDYYRFVVSTNSARAQFEVDNPSGDVTLVVRRGFPLPSLLSYDYNSTNSYTNMELIVVLTNSTPVPLAPGDWYLSVVNVSGGPVTYSVKATEWPVTGLPVIITDISFSVTNVCITWDSLIGTYYYVQGLTTLTSTNWVTISPSIRATNTNTIYCVPLPSPYNFFRVLDGIDLSQIISPTIVTLTNLTPYSVTNSAGTNGLDYYRYDVSSNAYGVRFEVLNPSGNVTLLARYGQPLPSLGLFDYISAAPGTNNELILVLTNGLPVPLTPGGWYLAVSNASGSPVSYTILATELTNPPPPIITLTNTIPYANSNSGAGIATDFYRFVVSTNSARVQFEVDNPSGDVTLVARKGLPLPSLGSFDYISTNAYTNLELIVVLTNSAPVALSSGDWYLSVVNVSGGPVTYSVKATEWPVTGLPVIITDISFSVTNVCITWDSLIGTYYYVQGLTTLTSTNWVTISPSIRATNTNTTYCVPLPSPYNFFRVLDGIDLSQIISPTIVTLTNLTPYSVTNSAGTNGLDYYRYNVSSNAYGVRFEVLNPSGNVTLLARYGQPVPSLGLFDYISAAPGTNNELIFVLTNGLPVPLTPGGWYLAVSNASGSPVNYTILATELTNPPPSIITLTNAIPYANGNSGAGIATDFYRFVVSTNSARVQFEVDNPSGDVTLLARKGLPLPSLGSFDYISTNSFTNMELIVVLTNSAPVALSPGDWYLSVLNVSGGPVSYSVKATELPATGLPVIITDISLSLTNVCITWDSLIGAYYYVQGVTGLTSTNWVTISPTILATNTNTTYCVPLPSPYNFFRVEEGLVLSTNLPPSNIITLTNRVPYLNANAGGTNNVDYYRYVVTTNAARVQFEVNNPSGDVTLMARKGLPLPTLGNYDYISTNSFTNDELIVFFTNSTPALTPGDWYLAVSNASGGAVTYGVKATETPATGLPVIITDISFSVTNVCITWDSLIGAYYYVQGVTGLTSTNWVTISPTILATSTNTTYCVPLPSPYNFFRVEEGLVFSTNLPPSNIITLTNRVPYLNANAGGTNKVDYYRYVVTTNAARVQFEVNNPSGDVTLMARKGLPLPTLGNYDYISTNSFTNDELIVFFTNSTPALTPGDWYLAVSNASGGAVTYGVKATETPVTGSPVIITDISFSATNVCLTWDSLIGAHYYVQGVTGLTSTNWVTISPTILATSTNMTYCVSVPSPYNFFRVEEGLVLSTNASTSSVITLTNATPYLNSNLGGANPVDYYRFVVATNAARAQFEINSPSGDVTLMARKGLPLPTLANSDYLSQNPSTNDELIVVFTNSAPVALTSGDWYLAVSNASGGAITYSVKASEWPVTGLPVDFSNVSYSSGSLCLTWNSLVGAHYYVQGIPVLTATNWTLISPPLVATNTSTTYCVPLPTTNNYFRVEEGLVVTSGPAPIPPVVSVTYTNSGFLLRWNGPVSAQYQAQWTTNIPPSPWNAFTNIITSATGQFLFFDNGSQTAGFGITRFYRVRLLP